MSAPGGETQTLEPRPRPAIWVVADAAKPLGKCLSSLGFLAVVSKHEQEGSRGPGYFSRMVLVLVTTSP